MKFREWVCLKENDEQSFLQNLSQNPKDITNWLIFADWLEEQGDTRSTLVRGLAQLTGQSKKGQNAKLIQQLDPIWKEANPDFKRALAQAFPLARYTLGFASHRYSRRDITLSLVAEVMRLVKSGPSFRRNAEATMDKINDFLGGNGVESIRGNRHSDNYFVDTVALYVNMGDPYVLTVLYAVSNGRFYITDYGTWVERNQRRYDII